MMERSGQLVLSIASDHPAFAGHFPGMPIVPGVVLLDELIAELSAQAGLTCSAWQISTAKFVSTVAPGEIVTASYISLPDGGVNFELFCAQRKVASGSLSFSEPEVS